MAEYPRMLVERAVDGFLLLNTPAEIDVPVPVVAISAHGSEPNVTHIVVDHLKAAELALTHLYELGHRRIAFMRGPQAIRILSFVGRVFSKLLNRLDLRWMLSWSPGLSRRTEGVAGASRLALIRCLLRLATSR